MEVSSGDIPQTVTPDADLDPNTYTCRTRIKGALCLTEVIIGDYGHKHGCPTEGDMCGARECNESGSCQA